MAMFEGKNNRKSKALAHLMSIALVFALFNRGMMLAETEAASQAGEQVEEQANEQVLSEEQVEDEEQDYVFVAHFAEDLQVAMEGEDVEIIELAEDIELEETLIIPEGANVAINGNGHYISSALTDVPAIAIESGGTLSLEDVAIQGQDTIDWGNGGITIAQGGLLTMGEGSFVRGFSGGGIIVNGGSFVLDGGTVAQNGDASVFGRGGGIQLNGGAFVMRDGEIRNNSARTGGGIFASGPAHIELLGGAIFGNNAEAGGGIFFEPPNPYLPDDLDQAIILEIGEAATGMIFDNAGDMDIRWVEGGPGIQGVAINDLDDFLDGQNGDDDDDGGFLILLRYEEPDEEDEDGEGAEEADGEEEGGEDAGEEGDEATEPDDEPPNDEPSEEDEPENDQEDEPDDDLEPEPEPDNQPEDEPPNSFADMMATNPQTGDELSFFGLIASATGFMVSIFILLAYREREKMKKTHISDVLQD